MSGVPPESCLELSMNKRTIPALATGVLLAAGLLTACGTATPSQGNTTTPATATTEATTPAATMEPTATGAATASPTATDVVAQPAAMTLTVGSDGKVTGRLVVKDTNQGVGDAEVSLVFRPTGGGEAKIVSVKTDGDGNFTAAAANGAGSWTAAFMGNDGARAAVASADAS